MIIVQHIILTVIKINPSWRACQISETQCGAVRVMEPSVNMTRTSLPYISIVFFTIVLRWESLSDICNIHKKAIQKKKVHNVLLVGLAVRFAQSHWFEKGVLIMIKG